jgi:hypothetical protein
MKARLIVLGTVLIAWGLNIFLFVNTGRNSWHLLLPASGGFYPLAVSSGEPTYHSLLMQAWFFLELFLFAAVGIFAWVTRSTKLAIVCSLLWLGSIVTGILRFALAMRGIN